MIDAATFFDRATTTTGTNPSADTDGNKCLNLAQTSILKKDTNPLPQWPPSDFLYKTKWLQSQSGDPTT